ncbi:TatD family deoxyribonuclease [Mucilaginibacter terrenus]|uniref:TatD family deoxyribonuclease n=1 Tax=Mucilaginibacter terrenus TaxID=2482727 RepID=A0A3E2NL15_9SPHI|nr:TatD family hydrolase [Mucilaginibacter terrenus]RFZ81694.1 TatD family deoxyribonuclease [Mucilaginibacter terrenus]
MVLTDTHTHLYYETDESKRAALMQRCFDAGVSRLFLPNVDSASMPLMDDLLKAYPDNCYAMIGLHPCSVKENWEHELLLMQPVIHKHQVYAIGEIGIDLYWDKTFLDEQIQAFRLQIKWAKQLRLPIVIHCRDAFNEVYEVLQQEKNELLRGIFHCFTGSLEQAQEITDLGFYLGIGGVVTYKNGGLDKVIPEIDLKHIVLETDSPYLTPVPYRGKPNESSYLTYIAQRVAELKNTTIADVAHITTENSVKVFGV